MSDSNSDVEFSPNECLCKDSVTLKLRLSVEDCCRVLDVLKKPPPPVNSSTSSPFENTQETGTQTDRQNYQTQSCSTEPKRSPIKYAKEPIKSLATPTTRRIFNAYYGDHKPKKVHKIFSFDGFAIVNGSKIELRSDRNKLIGTVYSWNSNFPKSFSEYTRFVCAGQLVEFGDEISEEEFSEAISKAIKSKLLFD